MRTQRIERFVAPEMLALSMLELILSFTLALISLTPSSSQFSVTSLHPAITCAITVGFTAFVIGLYRPQIFERLQRLLISTALSALLSFPAVWVVTKALGLGVYWPVGYDALRPLKIAALWSIGVLGIRLIFLAAARRNFFVHRVAIVGPADSASIAATVQAGCSGFLDIAVIGSGIPSAEFLMKKGVRTLVFNQLSQIKLTIREIDEYETCGIRIQTEEDFWERYLRRVDILTAVNFSGFQTRTARQIQISSIISRSFDLAISAIFLLSTLPIIVAVALVIRMESSGTVLYRQERVGRNSQTFTLYKFRSMRADAEAHGPRWAQRQDPRVTRVGSFMRKTRIDELPQLLNILRGDMSFIGPRPERPHFVAQLTAIIPNYEERSLVKPGLTGWAQVNYPYGASVEDAKAKLSYDLYYVKNRTFFLDVNILLSTVRVILLQEGAR